MGGKKTSDVNGYYRSIGIATLALLAGLGLSAQTAPAAPPSERASTGGFVLGPNDEIVVQALHVPEMDGKPMRLDLSGAIQLPLVGRIEAAGMSVEQLRSAILERLRSYIREPEVRIEVVAFHSQPVTVTGAVKNPGVFYLQGPADLATVLSLAGGLAPDAADAAQVKRERDCGSRLPGAQTDEGARTLATVRISRLMAGGEAGNVLVCPKDVISVPRARMVYVLGEVHRAGGFPLRDGESMSALQALALAEGPARTAALKHARLLRAVPGQMEREQREIDLSKMVEGKQPDVVLLADDILFLPNSASKSAAIRAVEAALQVGTGVVIWR